MRFSAMLSALARFSCPVGPPPNMVMMTRSSWRSSSFRPSLSMPRLSKYAYTSFGSMVMPRFAIASRLLSAPRPVMPRFSAARTMAELAMPLT